MQNLPIYLYQNLLDVTLDLDASIRGVNQVMYQRDLVIQKGVKNHIRIQFKNSDQKKVRVYSTQTYVFSMFDSINQRMLLEKPLDIIDDATTGTRGLAQLTLTESDTLDLDKSSYQFGIRVLDTDGSYLPTYSNTYYGVAGTLHIKEDIYAKLQPSVDISAFTKTYNPDISKYQHSSGNVYATPEFNGNGALHTIAFYLTAYKGTVYIQGTLDNSPGSGSNYTTISTRNYNGFSGVDYMNFNGVYTYIRVLHVPAQAAGEPDNDNPAYYGKFDKALYRS